MARQLKLWPWIAAGMFLILGFVLKAKRSRKDFLFFARAWVIWLLFCALGAALSAQVLRGLPNDASLWLGKWRSGDWQLSLWTLSTLPGFVALCMDLKSEVAGFAVTRSAVGFGLAFGPLLAGAFPIQQVAGLIWPLILLTAALRIRGIKSGSKPVWVLVFLNILAFVHGFLLLPPGAGAILLVALFAFGLNPGPFREGLFALILGGLGLVMKSRLGWSVPFFGTLLVCTLIYSGWFLVSKLPWTRRVETT